MKKYSFILQNGSLRCLLQRDENERFTSVSVDYTRIPFIGWFTWSWVESLEVIVRFPFPAKRRRNSIQALVWNSRCLFGVFRESSSFVALSLITWSSRVHSTPDCSDTCWVGCTGLHSDKARSTQLWAERKQTFETSRPIFMQKFRFLLIRQ